MSVPEIRIAWSKAKTGFTCYSFEKYEACRRFERATKAGFHKLERDTLAEAMEEIHKRIRHDWQSLNLPIPPIVECGKVSRITGETFTF